MADRNPAQAAQEQQVFERFLTACPSFAKNVVSHPSSCGDFPDIDAHLHDGTVILVELGEWIDGSQMADALAEEARGVTEPRGGAYDPEVALAALRRIANKKLDHYGSSARGAWLIIHYSRGVLYNTPFRSLDVGGFEDVARVVSELCKQREVPFAKVFLLGAWGDIDARLAETLRDAGYPVTAGPEAFEVFPDFRRCR